jgi:Mlc titration factor MtfA (ptsG expression regulator)
MFGIKRRRRARLRATRLPDEWSGIIARNVPLVARLDEADRAELHGHIQVFLDEKLFEGCGGLVLNDEVRVTIAAQACLLLLHRDTPCYPTVRTILVYPHTYVAPANQHVGGGLIHEGESVRLGESWHHGIVILSWDDVLHGAADIHDGQNLVLHEFAHQLDEEDGAATGAPLLPERTRYVAWARVLGAEFERLQEAAARGRRTVLDTYGATNPAEFFAVVTEMFFERPIDLRRQHPELYEQLHRYYDQDPAALLGAREDLPPSLT